MLPPFSSRHDDASGRSDEALPPLDDPYLAAAPIPSSRALRAVAARVGVALGVVFTCASGVVLALLVAAHSPSGSSVSASPSAPAAPAVIDTARGPVSAPSGARTPSSSKPAASAVTATKQTRVTVEGGITVVDVGVAVDSLADELARQRAAADAAGQKLVVMTTASRCDPCRGVDSALADPLLQTALARVRLVRVDIPAFYEELAGLRIPHERFPGFFFVGPDLSPRDGIDGGEWDDDIARNIAPVLGAFVRGNYVERREPWKPLPGVGVQL